MSASFLVQALSTITGMDYWNGLLEWTCTRLLPRRLNMKLFMLDLHTSWTQAAFSCSSNNNIILICWLTYFKYVWFCAVRQMILLLIDLRMQFHR